MKKLIKDYIDAVRSVQQKERVLDSALQSLNADNCITSLIPYEYENIINALLHRLIGADKFDWVLWWIENDYDMATVSDHTGTMEIKTFDEFYSYVFEHKTVSELSEERIKT